jgi:uncharacterized protein YjbJ (UPF0337 family)
VRRAFRSVLKVFPIEHLVREISATLISRRHTRKRVPPDEEESPMKPSTKDQVEGTLHEIKGNVKEKAGQVTNNPKLATKGQAEKLAGKVQMKVGQVEKVLGK